MEAEDPGKKNTINDSHLPEESKKRLVSLLEDIWAKAKNGDYSNQESGKASIGMFGTGFFTFLGKTDADSPRNFVQMCIDIKDMDDDNQILDRCAKTLSHSFKGMKAASASMVLHCLKPFTFPVFNSNMGAENIFVYFGVEMKWKTEIQQYINNVRLVKEFRDYNFKIKNYRLFDMEAWELGASVNHRIHEFVDRLLNEYVNEKSNSFASNQLGQYVRQTIPGILNNTCCFGQDEHLVTGSVGQGNWVTIPWIAIFNKSITTSAQKGVYIVYLMHKDGEKMYLTFNQGCTELRRSKSRQECSEYLKNVAKKLVGKIDSRGFLTGPNIDLGDNLDEKGEFYRDGTIFYKEYTRGNVPADEEMYTDLQKMCDIYSDYMALLQGEEPGDNLEDDKVEKQFKTKYDKNMILYGPPGTGKTYNTAIYAVAICDGKTLSELADYDAVIKRYEELKAEGRIAFTTFHQTYGYEEFIEGISPIISENDTDEGSGDIGYMYKDGVFKKFCQDARKIQVSSDSGINIPDGARIWNVNLGGKESPELKTKCFEEGSIRIGWDGCPEQITEDTENLGDKERAILLNFQDEMEIGDIVLSFNTKKSIDAIGIVTGAAKFDHTEGEKFPRIRTVKWISKEVKDIVAINSGVQLDRKSVYPLWRVSVNNVLSLIEGSASDVKVKEETRPYVFVIDEINRGNISKVFGELITLIEDTKREGMNEAASAILPYSKTEFSVPQNVYILGTMNTADRSIALMDTALRRRFQFVEMMPDADVLRKIGADRIEENGTVLDVAEMLETINKRIEYLFDREHTIGHAFFTSLKSDPSVKKLSSIFKQSVVPLLQEYFYEDYRKIMMVLGDNGKTNNDLKFILDTEVKPNSVFRGDTSDLDIQDYSYKIQDKAFADIRSYIEIKG